MKNHSLTGQKTCPNDDRNGVYGRWSLSFMLILKCRVFFQMLINEYSLLICIRLIRLRIKSRHRW